MKDEILVLIEWPDGDDYGTSVARATGSGTQWELIYDLHEIVETRSEAIETAARLFEEYSEVSGQ